MKLILSEVASSVLDMTLAPGLEPPGNISIEHAERVAFTYIITTPFTINDARCRTRDRG